MAGATAVRADSVTPERSEGDTATTRRTVQADLLSQAVMRFEPGQSLPRETGDSERAWFVVAGTGTLVMSEADSADVTTDDLAPDTGVYLPPGATCRVVNPGPSALEIVEVAAAGTPSAGAAGGAGRAVRWADQPEERAGGDRRFRVLVDGRVGAVQMTQFVGEIPRGAAPPHHHTYEEIIYVLAGAGVLHADGETGPLTPGTCVLLPRGVVHCLENTGTEILRVLGVFHPAGSPAEAYEA